MRVIVFNTDGSIQLADIINPCKKISRNNLSDLINCPVKILEIVPDTILSACKKASKEETQYLYRTQDGIWESTSEL